MVIAVIAILAALLLPALSGAKARAVAIQCLGNARQLGLTLSLYATDQAERLPLNGYGAHRTPGAPRLWVGGDEHTHPGAFTNTALLVDRQWALFADYLRTPAVYRCPADRSTAEVGDWTGRRIRTFALNGYVAWAFPEARDKVDPSYRSFRTTGDFSGANPAGLLTFIDTAPLNVCFPAFVIIQGPSGLYWHRPTVNHSGAGTLMFADGHGEIHKWLEPGTREAAGTGGEGDGSHFVWQRGNRDLRWLQEHATVPLPKTP